jgi:hypothetical protein
MVEKIVARRGNDFLMEFSVATLECCYFAGGTEAECTAAISLSAAALALVAASAAARGSMIRRTAIVSIGLTPESF